MAMIRPAHRRSNAYFEGGYWLSFLGTSSIPRRFCLLLLNLRWSRACAAQAERSHD